MSRPIAVPALPRASSATSAFSFCGIIDEPVAASSGSRAKPNSDRRPEHDLLADPREVAEEDGARVEVVEREVAVGDAVDRVAHRVGRRRDRERRAGERARAERARGRLRAREAEPRAVALEHLDPGEQVVAERHRDRALEVGVAGHRRLGLLGGALEHRRGRRRVSASSRLGAGVRDVEPEGGGDLVVARAAGVDLPADVAEQALDRRVDVLVLGFEVGDGDRGEPLLDLGELGGRRAARPPASRAAWISVPWRS